MGLKLRVDLETNRGPTKELYIRIDSWKINMTVNEIVFTTTSWLNKEYGDKFLRKYYTDSLNSAVGLVSDKVVYYENPTDDGNELTINNLYKVPMYIEKELEVPVIENREIQKEVPYISFDENGEEITLYRAVTVKEDVEIGKEKVLKKVVDYSIIDRLKEFSYNHLVEVLSEVFPKDKIEKLY